MIHSNCYFGILPCLQINPSMKVGATPNSRTNHRAILNTFNNTNDWSTGEDQEDTRISNATTIALIVLWLGVILLVVLTIISHGKV